MPSFSHLLFFALSHLLLLLLLIHESQSCPNSISFDCPDHAYSNGLTSLDFPFTNSSLPDCGVCTLTCENNNQTVINWVGWNPDAHYQALDINPSNHTILVGYPHPCEAYTYSDASFPETPSVSFSILQGSETVFVCPYENGSPKLDDQQFQICDDDDKHIVYGPYKLPHPPKTLSPPPPECSPKNSSFSIQYDISSQCQRCLNEGGRCYNYIFHGEVYCNHRNKGKHLAFIFGSAFSGLGAIILVLIIYWQRKCIKDSLTFPSTSKIIEDNRNFETLLRNYASLAPKRYTYSDIKKMSNSFGEKLGEGGFGAVYKGKLLDGRLVAVKLLKNTKGDRGGFINEVASIGRTNHVNVVALLGFCYEHHKRALVYEYMENGSLEKFMLGGANNGRTLLPLETLFQIVLGIARGLEYLHRGCKTRILHFDIKPHNILLDKEFCPKISDFGLAKLTPQDKQSKISMSGMRGTVGYIAPEVFCRTFGDVSHKSDVYSYGMMVLEVMGSRKKADGRVQSSSDLYFPEYIYKELEHEEGVQMDENGNQLKRKMIVVSLWCIQPIPSSRPSMSRVVQMLEGSPESIDVPPMPALSSPPRLQWDPSTSFSTTL